MEYPGWVSFLLSLHSSFATPYGTNISVVRFKSDPGLVAAFEAQRLPRSFLVLLESLLNETPAAKPSCERVAGAILEGKVIFSL